MWCGVPIHGAAFTVRTDSFHHIQEMEGWVLDDPVALGLPDKDFFADRLKMEAERFTTGTRGAIHVFSNPFIHCAFIALMK